MLWSKDKVVGVVVFGTIAANLCVGLAMDIYALSAPSFGPSTTEDGIANMLQYWSAMRIAIIKVQEVC